MLDKGQIILKEDTQALLERAVHVSGKEDVVAAATKGLHCLHEEKIGRSKGVTVLLHEGEQIQGNAELSVQPVNLQQVFVALCKE